MENRIAYPLWFGGHNSNAHIKCTFNGLKFEVFTILLNFIENKNISEYETFYESCITAHEKCMQKNEKFYVKHFPTALSSRRVARLIFVVIPAWYMQ